MKEFKGSVFVQGDFANAATKKLFQHYGYDIADTIENSDIVCWTGGSDINPEIYGERPAGASFWSDKRDSEDLAAIKKAGNRFKVGICRGAQLLNCVPNSGSLWQDVDRHVSQDHSVTDALTGKAYVVNSLHHQAMIPTDNAEIVAFTQISTEKYCDSKVWNSALGFEDKDIEALWYPDTRSLCLQWHPEFAVTEESGIYFNELMERFYLAA